MPEAETSSKSRRPKSGSSYRPPPWLVALRRIHTVPFFDGVPQDLPAAEEMTDEDDPGLLWDGADEDDPDSLARPVELRNHLLYLNTLALADLHKQGHEQARMTRKLINQLAQIRHQGASLPEIGEEILEILTALSQGDSQDDTDGDDDGETEEIERSVADRNGNVDSDSDGDSNGAGAGGTDEASSGGPPPGDNAVAYRDDARFPAHPVAKEDEADVQS